MRQLIKRLAIHEYPYEDVPDDAVMAPHHLYIGLILAWFGFQYVWQYYPAVGSTMTLLGIVIAADDAIDHAFGGYIRDWTETYLGYRMGTPIDELWRVVVRRLGSVLR